MSFHFPPELEEEIFILVVLRPPFYPTDVQLASVCKRVQKRIEPIFYETLKFRGNSTYIDHSPLERERTVTESAFEVALESKPPEFFRNSVKNVLFLQDVSEWFAFDLLSVCTGIQNLAICFDEENMIPKSLFPSLPALTHIEVSIEASIKEDTEVLWHNLVDIIQHCKTIKSVAVIIDEDYVSMDFEKRRVREWKAVDTRIQVVPSAYHPTHKWKVMVEDMEFYVDSF
ncbi:hypothetical protein BDQ17DRAFT_1431353 [Cyathus striatus]|nr:hypothetical protein BDQ17DRAFT_1431353 [Cyathus striatus]